MKKTTLIAALMLVLMASSGHAQDYDQNPKNNILILEQPHTSTPDNMVALNNPDDRIHIYPNPSRGVFFLNSAKTGDKIQVYDLHGRQVYDAEIKSERYPIDLSLLPKGIYTYHITDQGALVQQGKVVLE